jgi:hypothetical protein
MTDWNDFNAGIEYTAKGELIEDVEVEDLPKHSDGENVALRSDGHRLCWTEDLGANIINLDGYLHDDWSFGYDEIKFAEGRILIPEVIEMDFVFPLDELIEGAEQRAGEDASNVAYVLGGWTCQASGADHVTESSAKTIRRAFQKVMKSDEYDTPEDATTEVYHGGRK